MILRASDDEAYMRAVAEIDKLRSMVENLCERVAGQSHLLSRRAERKA